MSRSRSGHAPADHTSRSSCLHNSLSLLPVALTLTENHRLPVGFPQLESEYMGDAMGVTGILTGQWHAQLGILLTAQVTAWQGRPRKQTVRPRSQSPLFHSHT